MWIVTCFDAQATSQSSHSGIVRLLSQLSLLEHPSGDDLASALGHEHRLAHKGGNQRFGKGVVRKGLVPGSGFEPVWACPSVYLFHSKFAILVFFSLFISTSFSN